MVENSRVNPPFIMCEIKNPQCHLLDIRSSDSFNGWICNGENRKGHIKGAQSLPYRWLGTSYWNELINFKELHQSHKIIIYGSETEEINETAAWFHSMSYHEVYLYYDFIGEWTANPLLPMESMPKYESLVPPWFVKKNLRKDFFVICHCHYNNSESYKQGHIPGAIELDTLLLESSGTWNRRSPEEMYQSLQSLGIYRNSKVILYGEHDEMSLKDPLLKRNSGQLAAFRCAQILLYWGIEDVRILNGGLNSWIKENYELSKTIHIPATRKDIQFTLPKNPHYLLDVDDIKKMLQNNSTKLISVRSWSEFIGKESGYSYIKAKGRIPGSIFSDCGSDAYHMERYRNPDQSCRDYMDILKIWTQIHIDETHWNIFYCGTGWKASEAWFQAYLLGWEKIAVFDGGWFEWSNDYRNPIETGIPQKKYL